MRLIDADELHKQFYDLAKFKKDKQTGDYVSQRSVYIFDALRMINAAPTVNPSKSTSLERHGKWIDYDGTVRTSGHGLTCSECSGYVETAGPYCMHCGAKMEYREDD